MFIETYKRYDWNFVRFLSSKLPRKHYYYCDLPLGLGFDVELNERIKSLTKLFKTI
jgi:hypothetical protein